MKQEKSSGSDYELGVSIQVFCFHCFVKYNTVTERLGFTRSLRIGLAWVGLLSLRLPSTVVTHVLRMLYHAKNMSHLAEIYRLFPRRIAAEVVFLNDVHP